MIDKQFQNEILDSISAAGKVEEKPIKMNTNIEHILSFNSGAARIQSTCIRKAILILSKPSELAQLSNLQIRCVLCKKVISYPCWYYSIKYTVNHFHYFICFNSASPSRPSIKCL